uniref:Uncharacterized protein n=1 Tax=Picea sitchensis TaxID=3332 RepID=A9P0L5_PICSI|nr:unknown [Picea sitchensis]
MKLMHLKQFLLKLKWVFHLQLLQVQEKNHWYQRELLEIKLAGLVSKSLQLSQRRISMIKSQKNLHLPAFLQVHLQQYMMHLVLLGSHTWRITQMQTQMVEHTSLVMFLLLQLPIFLMILD